MRAAAALPRPLRWPYFRSQLLWQINLQQKLHGALHKLKYAEHALRSLFSPEPRFLLGLVLEFLIFISP